MQKSSFYLAVFVCLMAFVSPIFGQTANVYFNYPIPIEQYDIYGTNSRPLGASGNHSGEDIGLPAGTVIKGIGKGNIITYKKNSSGKCPYNGYGMLYAVVQHSLSRPLRVPVGVNTEITTSNFTMVYGHISNYQNPFDHSTATTGIEINDQTKNIAISNGGIVGWVAPHTQDCVSNDVNGDGPEHLHLGSVPKKMTEGSIGGYSYPGQYCPTHLVIAASRVGVYNKDATHNDPYWNGAKSQAFFDKWWQYMELSNYHNKLGRSNNNHPNKTNGEGTDFVHFWSDPGASQSVGVWILDLKQPYSSKSMFGDGESALMLYEPTPGSYQANLVRTAFWQHYKWNQGYKNLGAAKGDEYPITGGARQDFEKGTLTYDNATGKVQFYDVRMTAIQSHQITITSSPAGAAIWNAGKLEGNAPLTLSLYQGYSYTMTAKLNGYQDKQFSFTVGSIDMTVNVILTAGSSGGSPSPDYIITKALTCKGIDGNGYYVNDESEFTGSDTYAYGWVWLSNFLTKLLF